MRPRRPWLLLLGLALVGTVGGRSRSAAAGTIESREFNFIVDLPPDWVEEPAKGAWEKDGIRRGAKRTLTKLDDGKPATGQGAQLHVSVIDAPAGKTMAELAADPAQRELLMRYFGKQAAWPQVKSEDTRIKNEGLNAEVPAVRLITRGTSMTDAGTEYPCTGLMLVALAKKKLYRVRLLAWTTPNDEEQLRTDLDSVDIGFLFIDLSDEKPPGGKPDEPKPGEGPGGKGPEPGGGGEKVDGDADQELAIGNLIEGWKAKKPKKLATQEIDHVAAPYRQVFLRGNDSLGNCDLTLDVYPNAMIVDGKQVPPQDIRKFMTTTWWQTVTATYPKGPLETFAFPRPKGGVFLALPLLDVPPRGLYAEPKDRPKTEDVDAAMILKQMRFAEECKGSVAKVKVDDAYRGVIRGNRERSGPEIALRYAWRTEKNTFFIYVNIGREGVKRYLTPVKEFLESIEVSK